ncbi:ABC transporter permease subunit [Patescibacteria group bacterium]|nr:ABC transporter permease subunit [Patescibacteria group bacterium]
MQHYRHDQAHLRAKSARTKFFYYTLALLFLIFLSTYLAGDLRSFNFESLLGVFNRLSPKTLASDAGFTVLRVFAAYFVGLTLTLVFLFFIAQSKAVENFLVSIFDILQGVPVLAFFPLMIVVFARLNLPEIAALIVLVISSFWSVLFGAIGGYNQIPQDILDAARIFNGSRTRIFFRVILPAIVPSLVTGSIICFGQSWNVIIISEYINYGNISMRLHGLGNLLSSSSGNDNGVFIVALLSLVIIIFTLDRFLWAPLLNYSEKYKFQ